MNRNFLLGALIISVGIAAGQIVPWYVDRHDRLTLAEQREAERLEKEKRRAERIKLAEFEREVEEASRRADTAMANELAVAAVNDARSKFEAEVRPLTERYLAAHWKTLAELTNSHHWRNFKERIAQITLADENLGAKIATMDFDPTWVLGEKNRLNGNRAAAHQDNALISMIDGYIGSGLPKMAPSSDRSRLGLELARKPEQMYSLGAFSTIYGITSQHRTGAVRDYKARFLGNLGTDFDPNALRTVNRIWLAGLVLVDSTVAAGSAKIQLGPETPGNVIAPLCEDPRFIEMAKPIVGGKAACSYHLIDLDEPSSR